MFKILTGLLILAFVAYSIPNLNFIFSDQPNYWTQNQALLTDDLVVQSKPAVVYVEVVDTTQPFKVAFHQGTGFNVDSSGLILTNRHVVWSSAMIIVSFANGERYFARGYQEIPGYDLAVITLDSHDLPYLELETQVPARPGDIVTVIGNPMGLARVSQRGQVGEYLRTSSNSTPVLTLQMPITFGSSGSPVINGQGRVVGIVFASIGKKQTGQASAGGLAIPVQVLPEQLLNLPGS